jgi:hypothetical protein
MVEVAILGFMVSGAFLGFVYLDVIYQMIGLVIILKVLYRSELTIYRANPVSEGTAAVELEHREEAAWA